MSGFENQLSAFSTYRHMFCMYVLCIVYMLYISNNLIEIKFNVCLFYWENILEKYIPIPHTYMVYGLSSILFDTCDI